MFVVIVILLVILFFNASNYIYFFCNLNGIPLPFLASSLHVNSTCVQLIPEPAIIDFILITKIKGSLILHSVLSIISSGILNNTRKTFFCVFLMEKKNKS